MWKEGTDFNRLHLHSCYFFCLLKSQNQALQKFPCNLCFVSILSKTLKRFKSVVENIRSVAIVEQGILGIYYISGKKILHNDNLCKCQRLDSLNRFSTLSWGEENVGFPVHWWGGLCREQASALLPSSKPALFCLFAAKRVVASPAAQGWKDFTLYLGTGGACAVLAWCVPSTDLWKQAPSALVLMRITNKAGVCVTFCVAWLVSYVLWQSVGQCIPIKWNSCCRRKVLDHHFSMWFKEPVKKSSCADVSTASLHPNRYDRITVFSERSCEKRGHPTYLIPLKYCYVAEFMTSGHRKLS